MVAFTTEIVPLEGSACFGLVEGIGSCRGFVVWTARRVANAAQLLAMIGVHRTSLTVLSHVKAMTNVLSIKSAGMTICAGQTVDMVESLVVPPRMARRGFATKIPVNVLGSNVPWCTTK